MEPIDDLLGTMTIEDSHYVRIAARAPWGIAFPSRHLARLILVSQGSCWLTGAGLNEPRRLTDQDCFLVRAGATFELQDTLGRELVDCEDISGDPEVPAIAGGNGELTEIVSSRFTVDAVAADALFALLPPLTRISLDVATGRLLQTTFNLIAQETMAGEPAAGFVTSRLSEVLFVQALRACFAEVGSGSIGWLAALREPRLATAMRALHADLAHPWTLGELAHIADMSRSSFAATFRATAGDTPLGYLATWRMYRAKRLLRETTMSVHEVALEVGYQTGQALSRAFQHREGVPPGAWRRTSTPRARVSRAARRVRR
ncbi:AraC-like DNA-binding protein [Amycolatopsis cihanbeyliensis]|uniref:AraC-like DNA-binding protein n=1 Tax=Amycolatopsis cihanbeyliensis TaxID=1128664 RepID=A0A542DQG2_AMYCI|nr:AraC family transcriptional regulator [Amycolatopsis cihanbeyliensis]TQJ05342.1 AraC-like DNA-binding protein [Amycolatopsis cihanbeyliensis]